MDYRSLAFFRASDVAARHAQRPAAATLVPLRAPYPTEIQNRYPFVECSDLNEFDDPCEPLGPADAVRTHAPA